MICRRFSARATEQNAKAYYAFVQDTLLPELRAFPGHCGAIVCSRITGKGNEQIVVLTFWESMDELELFAGDATRAVLSDDTRKLFNSFDEDVILYGVSVNTFAA